MTKYGLTQDTINRITAFFSTIKEVEEVKIFGSRARGNYKSNSDIDFALFGINLTDKLIRHISSELDEIPTPYKYDVLDYKEIDNDNLKKNIDEDGKIFYKKLT